MGLDPYGPGPIWTWTHMGLGPYGPGPIWAWTHMGLDPYGPGPIWAWAHMGLDPYGPAPVWAWTVHFRVPEQLFPTSHYVANNGNLFRSCRHAVKSHYELLGAIVKSYDAQLRANTSY